MWPGTQTGGKSYLFCINPEIVHDDIFKKNSGVGEGEGVLRGGGGGGGGGEGEGATARCGIRGRETWTKKAISFVKLRFQEFKNKTKKNKKKNGTRMTASVLKQVPNT